MDPIKEYIEASKALQEKYAELRQGLVTRQRVLEQEFKPIITPLQNIQNQLKNTPLSTTRLLPEQKSLEAPSIEKSIGSVEKSDHSQVLGPLASKYLGLYATKHSATDTTFGIYMNNDGVLCIGNSPINVENDVIKFPDGEKYEGTVGLWELLTLKNPIDYDSQDLDNYEKIILKTYTYRRNNDPKDSRVKSSGGKKYLQIIKPLLLANNVMYYNNMGTLTSFNTPPRKKPKSLAEELEDVDLMSFSPVPTTKGTGLRKILTNTPVEYIYWNDLNELLDRLYIVYGEIKAGNNNPNLINEVVNILQEIREI